MDIIKEINPEFWANIIYNIHKHIYHVSHYRFFKDTKTYSSTERFWIGAENYFQL